jgi:phage-related protein
MRATAPAEERPLLWVGSSKDDLLSMPEPVVRAIGVALGVAQYGGTHRTVRPWKGEGPGVVEITKRFDGDTFRSVYTVAFRKAIYVLHCFQKKSPSGVRTARTDVERVKSRLRVARADYEARYGEAGE